MPLNPQDRINAISQSRNISPEQAALVYQARQGQRPIKQAYKDYKDQFMVGDPKSPENKAIHENLRNWRKTQVEPYSAARKAFAGGENMAMPSGFQQYDPTKTYSEPLKGKNFAKGGKVRGGGCEMRGKTKGKMV